MPRLFRRRRKWVGRLMKVFCIRHSQSEERLALKFEKQLLQELKDLRYIKQRLPTTFDDWEEVLWLAGLAVVAPEGAAIPVLNICLGFENYELKKLDVKTYNSYCDSHWDRVINQQGFARLACEQYPDEPVIDGLPASIWLECVEPTLSILKSLSILKHRKCNLTARKNLTDNTMDSGRSQHGDFMFGPIPPLLALPRRGIIRMEIRIGPRTEAPNLIQSSFNNRPLSRNFSRRHRERQLYRVSQYDDSEASSQVIVETEVFVPTTDTNTTPSFTLPQTVMVVGSERNSNQNANVQHENVGGRRPEVLPDIEVVDLEQLHPDQDSSTDQVPSQGNSRHELRHIPEWLIYNPRLHGNVDEDVEEALNDVIEQVVDGAAADPGHEEDEQEDDNTSESSDDSSSDQSEDETEDEHEQEDKEAKYGAIFEPRPPPTQQNSEVIYHMGHLVLNNWDLQREDEKCEDRTKYVWNQSTRVLERKGNRVGPPVSLYKMANTLENFFSTETGEWKNSAAGAKLMRLSVKDSYTRRHLMLAFNKVTEQREDGDPVEFRAVKDVNKLSMLQEVPTHTPSAPKPLPTTRRGRIRMRIRRAWANLRFRYQMLRARISARYA